MAKRSIAICVAVLVLFMGLGGAYYYFRGQQFMLTTGAVVDEARLLLIIDPGHGGADGGAVSLTGVEESEINLAIGLRLEALAALYGFPVEMTRRTMELDYPADAATIRAKKVADTRARVELINAAPYAVVISIHQNTYDGPGASGPQTLYAPTQGSEDFAGIMQTTLSAALGVQRPRGAIRVPQGVYIMRHIDPPAILVECGFLSNPGEEALLRTEAYQLKLAAILLAGYVQSMDLLEALHFGG
ncbi:MAG: N-acetylmuramoyl-L-alanine amidase [Oscillospiraceae bacterium]|nr:N-acetylmuramoyl-L-alanine amidase [Oscillospiraceae bacterium]